MCAGHSHKLPALLGDSSALLCCEQLQDPPVGLSLWGIVTGMGRDSWHRAEEGKGPVSARNRALPQGLADHVLVGDAVVGEGLVPGGVQGVAQRFGSQLVCLEKQRRWRSVGWAPGGFLGRRGSPVWG